MNFLLLMLVNHLSWIELSLLSLSCSLKLTRDVISSLFTNPIPIFTTQITNIYISLVSINFSPPFFYRTLKLNRNYVE